MSIINIQLNQLIELCRSYLSQVQYPMLASPFLQWVVTVADRSIIESNEQIRVKFLTARIWGCDELLSQIRTQLDTILNHQLPLSQLPPSSATVVDGCIINVNCEPSYYEYYRKLLQGLNRILIIGLMNESEYRHLKKRLREAPPITHARDVAALMQSGNVIDLVPDTELVDIRFLGDIYLLKNSKGILIEKYSGMENDIHYYIGQLGSQCRTIVSGDVDEFMKLRARIHLPLRDDETLKNYNECLSRDLEGCDPRDYRSLVRLVRENVSNPDYFDSVEDDDCNDPCLMFSTHHEIAYNRPQLHQ